MGGGGVPARKTGKSCSLGGGTSRRSKAIPNKLKGQSGRPWGLLRIWDQSGGSGFSGCQRAYFMVHGAALRHGRREVNDG